MTQDRATSGGEESRDFPVKLVLSWDLKPAREETYFEFVSQEFLSVMEKAGLQLLEAWYTMYGEWPQVRMVFLANDLQALRHFLESDTWYSLRQELDFYIHGFRRKIIRARNEFQF